MTDLTKLVKPLVFDGDPRWPRTAWAEGVGGSYQINEHDEDEWLLTTPKGDSSVVSSVDAAQAAANADHASRVVAALDAELLAEVVDVIREAILWDGEDDTGVPSVWYSRAHAILAKLTP